MSQPDEAQFDERAAVPEVFWLGAWKVEPPLNRVSRDDRTTHLEPKVMDVLRVLAEKRGRLASRSEIQTEVWQSKYVTDDAMTRAIFELRKALGDEARSPRYVETIHGRGYRLVAPISSSPPLEAVRVLPSDSASSARRGPLLGLAMAVVALVAAFTWLASTRATGPTDPSRTALREIPLTSSPGREAYPALSPDGRKVAFSMRPDPDTYAGLFVKDRDTGEQLRLTEGRGREFAPVWSSDGSEVAFLRCERGTDAISGVYVTPASGGEAGLLYQASDCPSGFDWSPDGRQLVLATRTGEDPLHGLLLVDLTTEDRLRLTVPPEPYGFDSTPRFSPDGRQVAFRRKISAGAIEIFVADLSGSPERQLTFDLQDISGLAWATDGKSLIFSSNRSGAFGLWRLPIKGGEPQWVGFENAFRPTTARGTGAVAFERRENDVHIRRVPNPFQNAEGTPSFVLESTQYELDPRYSADGRRIAFVSDRSGSHELWVAQADGSGERQLTSFQKPGPGWIPGVQHPRWSRDGSRILFAARGEGDFDIFTVPVAGGPARPVAAGPGDDLTPVWSPDGQSVYFVSNRGSGWQLWQVPSSGGELRVLPPEGLIPGIAERANGSLILTTRRGLQLFDPVTGDLQRLGSRINRRSWTVRPEGIYHLTGCDLSLANLETGETVTKKLDDAFMPASGVTVVASGLDISPDGQWLLYSAVERAEIDIILAEGPF